MEVKEIGSCQAILSGISTLKDGSVKVTLEINPSDDAVLTRLVRAYCENEKLLQVAFVGLPHG